MRIFISYSRRDTEIALKFANTFQQLGVITWMDQKRIQVGEIWREQIVKGITESDLFMILLSASSIISDNVRKELDIAESYNKPVIPILLEEVEIPARMQYQLAGVQHILFNKNFSETAQAVLNASQGDLAVAPPPPQTQTAQHSADQPAAISKRTLQKKLSSSYSIDEISELCFEIEGLLEESEINLQLNLDVLGGRDQGKNALILALIAFLDRRNYLHYLEEAMRLSRPGIFDP